MSLDLHTPHGWPSDGPDTGAAGQRGAARRTARWRDRRTRTLTSLVVALLAVVAVAVAGTWASGPAGITDLAARNQGPSLDRFFGTDRYGRDLFQRTLVGLRLSLVVGTVAAVMSGAIALVLSLFATVGGPF